MASGSSGRNNSTSKGFDFASDDILCSYEDYANQEGSNGNHSDPSIGANLAKVLWSFCCINCFMSDEFRFSCLIVHFRVLKIWHGNVVWELAVLCNVNAEFCCNLSFFSFVSFFWHDLKLIGIDFLKI